MWVKEYKHKFKYIFIKSLVGGRVFPLSLHPPILSVQVVMWGSLDSLLVYRKYNRQQLWLISKNVIKILNETYGILRDRFILILSSSGSSYLEIF